MENRVSNRVDALVTAKSLVGWAIAVVGINLSVIVASHIMLVNQISAMESRLTTLILRIDDRQNAIDAEQKYQREKIGSVIERDKIK